MTYYEKKYPLHLDSISSISIKRDECSEKLAVLGNIYQQILNIEASRKADNPTHFGAIVIKDDLASLLQPHWNLLGLKDEEICDDVVVVFLPDNFQDKVSELACRGPSLFNIFALDLSRLAPCFLWQVKLLNETKDTNIYLDKDRLIPSIFGILSDREWGWISTIFVSGNNVALGGFTVDHELYSDLQCIDMQASEYFAPYAFSDEQLDEAKKLAKSHGLFPSFFKRWEDEKFFELTVPLFWL